MSKNPRSGYENKVMLHESVSNANSTTTALDNGETFTGASDTSDQPFVAVFTYTDQDGTLYLDFSEDKTTWYTMYTYSILASTPESHTVSKQGMPYFRLRFTNDSGSNQTELTISARYVHSPVNIVRLGDALTTDSDAHVVKSMLVAEDPSGNPINVKVNTSGELYVTDDGAALTDTPEYFEDTSFVSGDSPVTLDINAALGRNATTVTIINDGFGDFTVELSTDGAVFGDAITIKRKEVWEFEDIDIDSIRITHVADSAYRVTAI